MSMQLQEVVLRSTSCLMMNRWLPEQLLDLRDKTRKKSTTAEKLPLQEEAALKVYTVDGKPVVPVENLFACLMAAGMYIRLDGKRQLSTTKSSLLPGMLTILTNPLWLQNPSDHTSPADWGIAEWKYDIRAGNNPNGDQAVAIVRPRFDEWAIHLEVLLDDDQLGMNAFRRVFDYAGARIGLMEFRPQRRGVCGMFRVDYWAPASKNSPNQRLLEAA
jgi:hypothetical protein